MAKKKTHFKRRHKYLNLILLIVGIVFAIWLARFEPLHQFFLSNQLLSYLGVILAGFLFVVSFTAPTGAVLLLLLAEKFNAVEIGIVAAFGAMLADYIIFKFVRDTLIEEVQPVYEKFGGNHLTKLLHTRYFRWSLPLIGALIIALPLPDEIGVSLLGLSKISTTRFLIISFVLNAIGIALIVAASAIIKP